MQLFVPHKERVADGSLVRSHQRKKTKKRACLARDISAYKLLGDAFRHPEDISRVFVVVTHQRFTAELSISRRIVEPSRDFFLQVDVQYVGGAASGVM